MKKQKPCYVMDKIIWALSTLFVLFASVIIHCAKIDSTNSPSEADIEKSRRLAEEWKKK